MDPVMNIKRYESEAVTFAGILKLGSFSEVHKGYIHDLNATKIVAKKFKGCQSDQKKEFLSEMSSFHRKLEKHDNIVNIFGCTEKFDNNYILMEYEALNISGKVVFNLFEYLIHLREEWDTRRKGNLPADYRIENSFPGSNHQELHLFSFQLLKGCEYLEKNNIVHGNLAARNILMTGQKTIKIADFGFVQIKTNLITSMGDHSSYYRWASFELLHNWSFSSKSDVWAFGTVLWEIGTLGAHPYPRISDEEVLRNLRQRSIIEPGPGEQYINFFSEKLNKIMESCRSILPEKRPSFKTLLLEFRLEKCDSSKNHGCAFYRKLNELGLNAELEFLPTKYDLDGKTQAKLESFDDSLFHSTKFLGEGKFGYVRTIQLNDPILGNITSAIKILFGGGKPVPPEKKIWFNGDIEHFKKIGIHRNIVKILAVCEEPIAIMTEYQSIHVSEFEFNNLNQYLKYLRTDIKKGVSNTQNQELGWFAIQIARGMNHLESLNIVHCNLTTKNVLINNAKNLKITDFCLQGTGIYNSKKGEATMKVENYRWAAPELLLHENYTSKSDVWAFGVVLWEISTLGAHPFGSQTETFIKTLIIKSTGVLPKPINTTEDLWNLMINCWKDNPDNRPDFKRILLRLNCLNLKRDIITRFDASRSYLLPTEEECKIQTELKNIASSHTNPPPAFQSINPYIRASQENLANLPSQQSSYSTLGERGTRTPNLTRRVRFSEPIPSERSRSLPRSAYQTDDQPYDHNFLHRNHRKSNEDLWATWESNYLPHETFFPRPEGNLNTGNGQGTNKSSNRISRNSSRERVENTLRCAGTQTDRPINYNNMCQNCGNRREYINRNGFCLC